MAETYLGQVILFGGEYSLRDFASCNGQALRIADNTALFSVMGFLYGGDGKETFHVPDLRGRFPLHQGAGPGLPPYTIGYAGGDTVGRLEEKHLPSHSHCFALPASNLPPDGDSPSKAVPATLDSDYYVGDYRATMGPSKTERVGGNGAIHLQNPFLAIHYQICLSGVYPKREEIRIE